MSFLSAGNQALTPKLHSLALNQSLNGIVIPIGYGTARLSLNLLWAGDFTSVKQITPGGKGFSSKDSAQYDYLAAILGSPCWGPVTGLNNIWSTNGRLTQSGAAESYTVPPGGGSYTTENAAIFASDLGAGRADTYNVIANDYGSPGPVTLAGTQQTPMQAVAGSPSAGEYSVLNGVYTFSAADAGKVITINYVFSLYVLAEQEDWLVPTTGPFEVTVNQQPYYENDLGVIFVDTGVALESTGGTPSEGQYNPNGGNYLFASADAGRPVAVSYSWNQQNTATDPTSTLSLSVIEGLQGQAPWSWLTSNHLSQAIGYSGMALIASQSFDLGPSATLPQYNYEMGMPFQVGGGIQDANPADCILDFLSNPLYGAGLLPEWFGAAQLNQARTYWQAAGFFISPVMNNASSASDTVQKWLDAGNCAGFVSEGLIKILPYGDTTLVGNGATYTPQTQPVVDLDDDDFLSSDSTTDPVQIVRTPWQDAYNSVKVQFNNRLNSYNAEIVEEFDQDSITKFGLRQESQQNYDFICIQIAAQFSANIRIKRLVYIRNQYQFTISGVRYCFLEPMDLVTLTDLNLGLNKTPVRIIELEEDEDGNLKVTAEQFPWGTATATEYGKQTSGGMFPTQAQAAPGNVNTPVMFEALDRLTDYDGYELWFGLSSNNPNWGGCHVWLSEDGTNYTQLDGAQNGPARQGVLTAALAAGSDPDTANTLAVSLAESLGELQTVTKTQADQLRTLCYVDGELIGFETATLTAKNQYGLTYLRRGALGTPNEAHASGANFLRLDDQVFTWIFDASQIGKTLFFKFTSFNLLHGNEQSLADVEAYSFTLVGSFQGAVSATSGAYIGGIGSSAITFNTDFTYTNTPTSITVSGSVSLFLTNLGLSNVTIPISMTVTGLTLGTSYWLFPYATKNAYGQFEVDWVTNGNNGVSGAVGSPAVAFPAASTASPIGSNAALTQFYASGSFTPLSGSGLNVTTPASGSGGGSGGGTPPPICPHESMLVDALGFGQITVRQLHEIKESGEDQIFVRDGERWELIDMTYMAPTKHWCRIFFENGEEAVTTEGHWWLVESGQLVCSSDLEGLMVECDEGFSRAVKVEFFDEMANFVRLVIRSKRQMFNTGMKNTRMRTHNWTTNQ